MSAFSRDLTTLIQLVDLFRGKDDEMPMQKAHTFLLVAMKPGISMQDLVRDTGLSTTALSRNIQSLSKWEKVGRAGKNLVEAVVDPHDTRRKLVYLTAEGRAFASQLIGALRHDAGVTLDVPLAREATNPMWKQATPRA